MVQMLEKYSSYENKDEQKAHNNHEQVVQIIIVDAHTLQRAAWQRVLASFPRMHVCASVAGARELSLILRGGRGDVLLLGSSLTAADCLACVKIAHTTRAGAGIVSIQQKLCRETLFPLLKSGIQSILGEDASEKDLEQSIMAAAMNSTFLGQRAREMLTVSSAHIPLHFTTREMQVLPLLSTGISNSRIAQQLGLKEKTVEKHLTHIYEKLHTRSRTETVLRLQALHI